MKPRRTKSPRLVVADGWSAAAGRDLAAALVEPAPRVIATEHGGPVRPFAIGLGDQLADLRRPGVNRAELDFWLARYVRAAAYLLALAAAGSERHDLDGNPVCAVAPEHRAGAEILARRKLDRLRAVGKAKPKAPKAEPSARPFVVEHEPVRRSPRSLPALTLKRAEARS